jgi:hypothetical protein
MIQKIAGCGKGRRIFVGWLTSGGQGLKCYLVLSGASIRLPMHRWSRVVEQAMKSVIHQHALIDEDIQRRPIGGVKGRRVSFGQADTILYLRAP